jgi:hypothetical protein
MTHCDRLLRPAEVNPIGNTISQFFPFLDIRKSGFTTQPVEFFDAKFFDLLFVVKTQLLFHFDFDGQSVRIPTTSPVT